MKCTMNFRNGFGADHQTAVNNSSGSYSRCLQLPQCTGSSVFGSSSPALLWWSSEKSERLGMMEANCLSVAFCFNPGTVRASMTETFLSVERTLQLPTGHGPLCHIGWIRRQCEPDKTRIAASMVISIERKRPGRKQALAWME